MMSSVLTIVASAAIAYSVYEVTKKKGFDKRILLTSSVLGLLLVSAIVLSFVVETTPVPTTNTNTTETCIELKVVDSLQQIINEKEAEITALERTIKTIEASPKTPYDEPKVVPIEKPATEKKTTPKKRVNEAPQKTPIEKKDPEAIEIVAVTVDQKDEDTISLNNDTVTKIKKPKIKLPFRNHVYDIEVYNCKENKELKSRNKEFCFVFKSNHKDLLRESTLEFLANGIPLRIIKAQRIQQGRQDIHHAVYYIRAYNDEHLYQGKNQVMIRVKNVPFYLNFLLRR